jgi:hypothetical protein
MEEKDTMLRIHWTSRSLQDDFSQQEHAILLRALSLHSEEEDYNNHIMIPWLKDNQKYHIISGTGLLDNGKTKSH